MMRENQELEQKKTNLISHFNELKLRLIYTIVIFLLSFAIAYYYVEDLYQFLLSPLAKEWASSDKKMIYTSLAEIFFSYLKLAYYVALFVTIPFFMAQLYIFMAPGLYRDEKRAFLPFIIMSPILFFLGAVFVYYVIFPLAWKFFLGFEQQLLDSMQIKLEAKVSEYLHLTMSMILAFGVAFQLPLLLLLLAKIGIITSKDLKDKRRFAIVSIFILAAILTPPDAISQIGLAIPMLILYEITILICKKMEKDKRNA